MTDPTAGINSAIEKMWKAACGALDETTNEIFLVSTLNYCPVDKGDLKGSAKNELKVDSSTERTRELSYNMPYALPVHEILTNNHPHGSAKYLETPLKLYESKLRDNIASAAGDAL